MHIRFAVAAQVACALLIGCSGSTDTKSSGGPDTTGTGPPKVAIVTLTPPSLTVQVGSTGTFVAQAFSSAGAAITGKTATWTSSNAAVATVAGGVVTGIGAGNALITATIDGVNAVASVTVTAIPPGQANFASIAPGGAHTCALTATGQAYCWGHNLYGELGDGTQVPKSKPTLVSGGIAFASISAGNFYTCGVALSPQGSVYCWGQNPNGQLGDGSTAMRLVPTRVNVGVSFVSVSAGAAITCGLSVSGLAYCWGTAPFLGNGTVTGSTTPTVVANPAPSAPLTYGSVGVGQSHACGFTTDHFAYCWGNGSNGVLGDADPQDTTALVPNSVNTTVTFRSIAVAYNGGCGIATNNTTYCWGLQLPPGASPARTPTALAGNVAFASLGLGPTGGHGCALTAAGAAYCWGSNSNGQIGDNGPTSQRTTPALVSGGLTWKSIMAGGAHTCGLTTTGAAYCWGSNSDGQLGNSNQTAFTPSAVLAP